MLFQKIFQCLSDRQKAPGDGGLMLEIMVSPKEVSNHMPKNSA